MSRAWLSVTGLGGMPVAAESEAGSRIQATRTSGWFGSRPAINGREAKPSSDPPTVPPGQATPGTA